VIIIRHAQLMVGAQLRGQLNNRGAEFHNQQIRLGKRGRLAAPAASN
jgi:hypothetical protein